MNTVLTLPRTADHIQMISELGDVWTRMHPGAPRYLCTEHPESWVGIRGFQLCTSVPVGGVRLIILDHRYQTNPRGLLPHAGHHLVSVVYG